MPRGILLEEFHLTVLAPRGLPDSRYVAMRTTLASKRFQTELRQAGRAVLRRFASLSKSRVRLSM